MALYLLPNLLDDSLDHDPFLPPSVGEIVRELDGFIVESEKPGRRFIKRFIKEIQGIPVSVLNEHTTAEEVDLLAAPLQRGERWGLLSDAGLPVLADPGARLIRRLHGLKIPVHTFPGPSAIIYALQLSGLSAQSFTFHGYLPRKPHEIEAFLRTLPKRHTHIAIEAPYRTDRLLQSLITHLPHNTQLSVAWDLTLPSQGVRTEKVSAWRKESPNLGKVPAVFIFRGDDEKTYSKR
ncbi:MAG: Ribosomal RNA small subunit methyltransferase I [Chlamydiae bacterium]|nr:Ribosomal RNA small subunit methyltransferase I [Chlamydiota bacterium]